MSLVESSGIGRGDLVLDLGAGDGAITRRLADRGARVIAFELHPGRVAALRARFDRPSLVKVVRADITDLRLPRHRFSVVANPPFGCVSRVLAQLTSHHSRMERATLVLPVSVAARWQHRLARRPTPWTLTVVERVPRSAFTPRPRVDCCVVHIGR
ncbi:MAG: rRNA adenine N-6-methyltransferase family protein [Actinomycetota bacterium]